MLMLFSNSNKKCLWKRKKNVNPVFAMRGIKFNKGHNIAKYGKIISSILDCLPFAGNHMDNYIACGKEGGVGVALGLRA